MGNLIAKRSTMMSFLMGSIFGLSLSQVLARAARAPDLVGADDHTIETPDDGEHSYRLILGVRTDLKMQKGKVAAQCAHGAVAAYEKASKKTPHTLKRWKKYGQAKITVKIDSEEEMMTLDKEARRMGIVSCVIRDAGRTQIAPDSRTVIALGPAPKHLIDQLTGHLKLY